MLNAKTLASLSFTLLGLLASAGHAQTLDLGDPSVLSQQGQRLKVAVPYGGNSSEDISLLRFNVESVQINGTEKAPSARGFTISKPEKRNVLFLQSAEIVDASQVKLVLAMAGNPGKRVELDLTVPPGSATTPIATEAVKPAVKQRGKRKARSAMTTKARRVVKR